MKIKEWNYHSNKFEWQDYDDVSYHAILFDNGIIVLAYHYRSCCESVYADFEALEDTKFESQEFDEKTFTIANTNDGFLIKDQFVSYFVPCYNSQNGYYSDNLNVEIRHIDKPKKVKQGLYYVDTIDNIY